MKIDARRLAMATAALLLLGLAGLATVDDSGGSTRVTTAAAATTAAKTARVAMTATFATGPGETKITGEGTVDIANERSQMTVTSAFLPAPAQLIADGDTTYLDASLPQFQAIAQGKRWVALSASSGAPGVGSDPLGGAGNPVRSLRLLADKEVARDLRQIGTEDVRGAPTTRHVGKLDVEKMLEATGRQASALAGMFRDARGELELWLDDDDRVRRSVFRITFQAGGQSLSSTSTMEFFDFGVAVDITPPPADQVHRFG